MPTRKQLNRIRESEMEYPEIRKEPIKKKRKEYIPMSDFELRNLNFEYTTKIRKYLPIESLCSEYGLSIHVRWQDDGHEFDLEFKHPENGPVYYNVLYSQVHETGDFDKTMKDIVDNILSEFKGFGRELKPKEKGDKK